MVSKYFLPKSSDLEFETLEGWFPCQIDDCESAEMTAKHYKSLDKLAWTCPFGHDNYVQASDYV